MAETIDLRHFSLHRIEIYKMSCTSFIYISPNLLLLLLLLSTTINAGVFEALILQLQHKESFLFAQGLVAQHDFSIIPGTPSAVHRCGLTH